MPRFTIKANSGMQVSMPARFVFVDSITDNLSINIRSVSKHVDIDFDVRQSGRIQNIPVVVDEWYLKNPNPVDVEVVFQAGDVFYDEGRVNGAVDIVTMPAVTGDIDILSAPILSFEHSAKTKTKNYYHWGVELPGLSSNYSFLSIENPAASGVEVRLEMVGVYGAFATFVRYGRKVGGFGAGGALGSKFNNASPASKALISSLYSASLNPVAVDEGANWPRIQNTSYGVSELIKPGSPIVLNEGEALILGGVSVATTVGAELQWLEV